MKPRTWALLISAGVILLVGGLAYWYLYAPKNICECGELLSIERGYDPSWPTREINATDVEARLPEFHALLETAHRDGLAFTNNLDLIQKIRNYVEEATGSIEHNDNLRYREKTFRLAYGIQ